MQKYVIGPTQDQKTKTTLKQDIDTAWMFVTHAEQYKAGNPGLATHFFVLALETILRDRKDSPADERVQREQIAAKIMGQAKDVKATVSARLQAVG